MDPSHAAECLNPLDLNAASAEELEALDGIGPALAERIVADRAAAGLYASVDDVVRVSGIGPALVERLRSHITAVIPEDISVPEPAPAPEAPPEPFEQILPAEDEAALEAELLAYEGLTLSDEELPPLVLEESGAAPALTLMAGAVAQPEPQPQPEPAPEPHTEPQPMGEQAAPVEAGTAQARPAPQATSSAARPAATAARIGFAQGALLVLLGGLLGVLLTGLALALISGTLDYAPRRLVLALSRNMDTMQANQEVAWERLNEVIVRANDAERRLARIEGLADRVADIEAQASANSEQLATLDAAMDGLDASLAALEADLTQQYGALDGRLTANEAELVSLGESVDAVQTAVDGVRERIGQFDLFIQALRELLVDLDGLTEE